MTSHRRLLPGLVLLASVVAASAALAGSSGWPDGAYNPYGTSELGVLVDHRNLTEDAPAYLEEWRAAERFWAEGGNGELTFNVTFHRVQDPGEAQVLVSFHRSPSVPCGREDHGVGCGGFGNRTQPGIVRLAMYTRGFEWRPPGVLGETARHELGHALGLDHSDDPADIMYPRNAGLRSDPQAWNAFLKGGILVPGIVLGFFLVFWTVAGRGDEGGGGGDGPPEHGPG